MKGILIVLTLSMLLIVSAGSVKAEGFQVGVDSVVNWENNHDEDGAYSGYILNGQYVGGSFKVGFDYLISSYPVWDGPPEEGRLGFYDVDENFLIVKGGYKLTAGLYATLTYFLDDYDGASTTAYLLGIDGVYHINDKLSIAGYLDYSFNGSDTYSGDADIVVQLYGLEFNYQFTKKVGANVGYKYIKEDYSDADGWIWESGLVTAGITYNF